MAASNPEAPSVSVEPATEQDRPVVARLLQFMLYDLSPLHGEWIGDDGRYAYGWLDAYWTEPDRHAYVIRRNAQLAGFALVTANSPISGRAPCWFMAEFFVLAAQRRCGCGLAALRQIATNHPGDWEIAVDDRNHGAVSFWASALPQTGVRDLKSTPRNWQKSRWTVHSFMS